MSKLDDLRQELSNLDVAVIENLGYDADDDEQLKEAVEQLKDLRSAQDGYTGFTYYNETEQFYKDNKQDIKNSLNELADDLGENVLDMIKGFGAFRDSDITIDDIGEVYYGNNTENEYYTDVTNALAWYALEETAHKISDWAYDNNFDDDEDEDEDE